MHLGRQIEKSGKKQFLSALEMQLNGVSQGSDYMLSKLYRIFRYSTSLLEGFFVLFRHLNHTGNFVNTTPWPLHLKAPNDQDIANEANKKSSLRRMLTNFIHLLSRMMQMTPGKNWIFLLASCHYITPSVTMVAYGKCISGVTSIYWASCVWGTKLGMLISH